MTIITTQDALNRFCATISNAPFITIDTEFLREKTYYPKLCLIQISCPAKTAAAIDPLIDHLDLTPVFDLLRKSDLLKIFHAGRQDLEIFYQLMGDVVRPVFDTQIAAMVCGYGESIGYSNIVQQITDVQISKASQFTDWARRPLSDAQIDYALGDVTHLIDVYHTLKTRLEETNRSSWVEAEDEILSNPVTYDINPDESWRRIKIKSPRAKNLAVLKTLAAWREIRAQKKNIPRNWVLKDDVMAAIALQLPKTKEALAQTRNIPKGLVDSRHGGYILKMIKETLAGNPENWPIPAERMRLSADTKAAIEILRMLLKIKAEKHGVAPKLIAGKDDIQAIAMGKADDIPALKGWRADVFGHDAQALLQGKIALGLKDGKISYFEV
jgi:ribonuclease D